MYYSPPRTPWAHHHNVLSTKTGQTVEIRVLKFSYFPGKFLFLFWCCCWWGCCCCCCCGLYEHNSEAEVTKFHVITSKTQLTCSTSFSRLVVVVFKVQQGFWIFVSWFVSKVKQARRQWWCYIQWQTNIYLALHDANEKNTTSSLGTVGFYARLKTRSA